MLRDLTEKLISSRFGSSAYFMFDDMRSYSKMSAAFWGGLWDEIDPPDFIPSRPEDLINLIKTLISTAYAIAGVAAVAVIIYAGYLIIMSAGEPDKLRKAQSTLWYAVVGLVVVVSSSLIFNFIAHILKVENLISVLNLPFL